MKYHAMGRGQVLSGADFVRGLVTDSLSQAFINGVAGQLSDPALN
jgi:hypothetical protein